MRETYLQDDKIISLAPRRAPALYPALAQVESYWEGLRDGRLIPMRSEVDPRGIADALEHAFILETIAPGLARFRIAGMGINALMDMEVRGMPLSAMFLPEARRAVQNLLASALETPAALRLTLRAEAGFARRGAEGRMLLLPLRDNTGAPTRILGAVQTVGPIRRRPCRFSITDVETRPLFGGAEPPAYEADAGPVVAESAPAPAHAPAPQPQASARAHLRLVHDADAR